MLQAIQENWAEILVIGLPLLELIVRLTPTKVDNSIFNLVKVVADYYVKNNKKGGGTHG